VELLTQQEAAAELTELAELIAYHDQLYYERDQRSSPMLITMRFDSGTTPLKPAFPSSSCPPAHLDGWEQRPRRLQEGATYRSHALSGQRFSQQDISDWLESLALSSGAQGPIPAYRNNL